MKRKAHPPEHMGELNIVPYLDIVVNLVMFMLMSMTGFITFNMINVTTPDLTDDSAVSSTPPPKDEKKEEEFVLNVSIARCGFVIAASGGVLGADEEPAEQAQEEGACKATVPLKASYTDRAGAQKSCEGLSRPPADCYDYEALALKMASIKARRPDKSQYFLAADRTVSYSTVVQTMDATRGDAQHPLFPDVAFAAVQ